MSQPYLNIAITLNSSEADKLKNRHNQYSGIGGQAVLEGIMMKNKEQYAIAVRKPDGEIEVDVDTYHSIIHDSPLLNVPFIRGIFNFIDSLILGMKSLNFSSTFYEDADAKETAADRAFNKIFKDKAENVFMGIVTVISIILAVALFMVLPYFLTSLLQNYVRNASLLAILEGVIRILIFVLYVVGISLMKDIQRVYMYHGAEHKCINCIEKGRPLTVRNVMRSSKQHKRCGTSFLLFVMLVSIVLFFFIRVENPAYRVLLRIALIPVIAGISYEIIRLAGRSNNILVRIISAPGLWLQRLTTKEPDADMVEVAIAAVEAVFDWKGYIYDTFGYEIDDEWMAQEAKDEEEVDEEADDENVQERQTQAEI
ncbi:MAG: DUF1385 domain-containing protein [Lachnospiraceae bacterium]|nr:DUF1385 domain-containing protein [Lachnospiraceae bacterium]